MRLTALLILFTIFTRAQSDSTAITIPLVGVNFGAQLPFGDMADRFGPDLRAGGSFLIKTKKNWIFGVDAFYLFGKNVKEDVLKQLTSTEGHVTDNEGYPADLRVSERGLGVHAHLGGMFNFNPATPNSGIVVTVGVGYLYHKINLYDAQRRVAAVFDDRKRGYDRLSGGLSFSQFVGYMHLSDNRLWNYYLGFELYETLAKSYRKLNYDTGLTDTKTRFDGLLGLRVGWILPLYKKTPNEFYYN